MFESFPHGDVACMLLRNSVITCTGGQIHTRLASSRMATSCTYVTNFGIGHCRRFPLPIGETLHWVSLRSRIGPGRQQLPCPWGSSPSARGIACDTRGLLPNRSRGRRLEDITHAGKHLLYRPSHDPFLTPTMSFLLHRF